MKSEPEDIKDILNKFALEWENYYEDLDTYLIKVQVSCNSNKNPLCGIFFSFFYVTWHVSI